jgi:hypothetical protein
MGEEVLTAVLTISACSPKAIKATTDHPMQAELSGSWVSAVLPPHANWIHCHFSLRHSGLKLFRDRLTPPWVEGSSSALRVISKTRHSALDPSWVVQAIFARDGTSQTVTKMLEFAAIWVLRSFNVLQRSWLSDTTSAFQKSAEARRSTRPSYEYN